MEFLDLALSKSSFRFVDKETNVELEKKNIPPEFPQTLDEFPEE